MSPEQTIIVAKTCEDYKESNTLRFPPKYAEHNECCKSCAFWQLGRCEKAKNILLALD